MAKLIRYVRRTHFDKQAQKWDDEDLKTLFIDLREQATDCAKENQEMLDEIDANFSVQIRYYDENGDEEFGVNPYAMDNILENWM